MKINFTLAIKLNPPKNTMVNFNFFRRPISAQFFIGFSVCLTIAMPFLLTQHGSEIFNFTETGQIGDTIGGLTSPVIGILNAILLYYTFRKQAQQSEDQRINADIDRKLDKIRDNIRQIQFKVTFTDESPNELIEEGIYFGSSAMLILSNLFTGTDGDLRAYRINIMEWMGLEHKINEILIDAIAILMRNSSSIRHVSDRELNFIIVTTLLHPILTFYEQVELYDSKYPQDDLAEYLGFERIKRSITDFRVIISANDPSQMLI